ncbi:TOBE domain-containing protein [Hahella sp. NBU794]|uniref:TOBE domain-containing protein n=1 Tax=Hahella sp. NBU794 TaxID=3422590 RepID=UPI003D6F0DC2
MSENSDSAKVLELAGEFWLNQNVRGVQGGSRIALLEHIDSAGSITKAAKLTGISYKTAWDAVDAMNNLSPHPVVERATGGKQGGGARLTPQGRKLVSAYRAMEAHYSALLSRLQRDIDDFDDIHGVLQAMAIKTSARNQFRGVVSRVQSGAVNAEVALNLGDGLELVAVVTQDSVQDLGLTPGRTASAIIKSSFVILATDETLRLSARNRLCGVVSDIRHGQVNAEVRVRLSGDRTLTAVITEQSLEELGLTEGAPCQAYIKASHIILAVNQ